MLIIAQSTASGHSRSTDNSSVSDVVGLSCNSFFFKNYPVWTATKRPKLLILVTSCVYPAEASSHSQDSALLNVSSFREIVGNELGMLLLQMVIVLMNIISHGIFSPLSSCWSCFESSSTAVRKTLKCGTFVRDLFLGEHYWLLRGVRELTEGKVASLGCVWNRFLLLANWSLEVKKR